MTMTTTTSNEREDSLATKLKKARLALTDEELQFFPKTNSMLDQPKSQWVRSSHELYKVDQIY